MKGKDFIRVLFLAISIVRCVAGFGQKTTYTNDSEIGLHIGERVPDIEFSMIDLETNDKKKVHLSDFKERLIILDFWATWCISCISTFPKLDSLQQVLGNMDFQVILINSVGSGDNEQKIRNFFKKKRGKNGQPFNFISMIEDSIAKRYFPHNSLPHYVWLTPSEDVRSISSKQLVASLSTPFTTKSARKTYSVKAITYANQINYKNIFGVLNNENIKLPVKKDFFQEKTLYLGRSGETINIDDQTFHSVFKRGKLIGLSKVDQLRILKASNNEEYVRGIAMRNVSLFDIYKASIQFNKEFKKNFTDKHLILEIKDSISLFSNAKILNKESQEDEHLYSYDLIVPIEKKDSIFEYILKDLNSNTDYYGRIEKRKIKCFAIIRTSSEDKIKTKGGKSQYKVYNDRDRKFMTNLPISRLISGLNNGNNLHLLIFDETNYSGKVDLEFPVNLNDIIAMKKNFRQYDLDIIEIEKDVDIFVISNK